VEKKSTNLVTLLKCRVSKTRLTVSYDAQLFVVRGIPQGRHDGRGRLRLTRPGVVCPGDGSGEGRAGRGRRSLFGRAHLPSGIVYRRSRGVFGPLPASRRRSGHPGAGLVDPQAAVGVADRAQVRGRRLYHIFLQRRRQRRRAALLADRAPAVAGGVQFRGRRRPLRGGRGRVAGRRSPAHNIVVTERQADPKVVDEVLKVRGKGGIIGGRENRVHLFGGNKI
jgi:hypothetical protein